MFLIHNKIFKTNYSWELSMFHKIRDYNDGITFVEFITNLDTFVGDHNPNFQFSFIVLNYVVFDFSIYSINHAETA